MYITKNEINEKYFHRFAKVKINGKPWEVQAADSMNFDGVIVVALLEDYSNSIAEEIAKEQLLNEQPEIEIPTEEIFITGTKNVYPYDEQTYFIEGMEDSAKAGVWSVDNSKIRIEAQDPDSVLLSIVTGRSGTFNLIYTIDGVVIAQLPITIESL